MYETNRVSVDFFQNSNVKGGNERRYNRLITGKDKRGRYLIAQVHLSTYRSLVPNEVTSPFVSPRMANVMNEHMSSAMVQPASSQASSKQDQENSWVLASQSGDTRAFNCLVLKWEKTVYNVALRMLRDRDEAAEATQEVFITAFRNIRRFRRDSKFSTWIYRIALNHCLTRVKQRPPGTHLALEDESADSSPAPQLRVAETQVRELMRREQQKRVLAALLHLSPDQQAVIELKFLQDRTFEEIAAILEIPLSTIKSRLYSGLELLKIRLGSKE